MTDCKTNPHTETERKRNPVGGDPERHPKATARPEGHTAGTGESRRINAPFNSACARRVVPCLQLLPDSAPQETQEESEHQQVPQKETLQDSIASEVRRPPVLTRIGLLLTSNAA